MLSSIINGLQQLNMKNQDNTFSFQKGKIFFGLVKNIYPNHFALLQIGNQNLIAKLEVALTNGESYWFQVDSDEGDIQLKLLSDKQQTSNNMTAILKQLSLPSTKTNMEIVDFFSKEQIPFTKGSVRKISGWITNSSDMKQDFKIVKQMMNQGLPLNESIYKSLLTGEQKEPIQHQLQTLQQLLSKEVQTPTVKEIQSAIYSIQNIQSKQIAINLIQALMKGTVIENKDLQRISSSVLQNLGKDIELHSSISKPIFQLDAIKNQFELLKEQTDISNSPIMQKLVDNTVKVINQFNTKEIPNELSSFSQQENDFLSEVLNNMKQSFNGKEVLHQFKEATKSLGLFYEYQVSINTEDNHVKDLLKPLLVKFLQESDHFPEVREIADSIVNKMNGQQIQMYDNGPLQHLFYEIPVQLFGFKTNLTMQWAGKKGEDGKIDPNYCHILFYLNLEHLQETIVEMKVQNRIINVNVYNETQELKEVAMKIVPALKTNLEELHYHLSAIHFMEKPSVVEMNNKANNKYGTQAYTGVDLRV
ncbi:MAG: hypothetical protein ACO1OT_09790 [Heyndrickxia sp.]